MTNTDSILSHMTTNYGLGLEVQVPLWLWKARALFGTYCTQLMVSQQYVIKEEAHQNKRGN